MKRLTILLGALALAGALGGCGKAAPLEPAPGAALPPAPYGAAARKTPDQLLTAAPEARPDRSDELLRRSQRRAPDEFDLPPE